MRTREHDMRTREHDMRWRKHDWRTREHTMNSQHSSTLNTSAFEQQQAADADADVDDDDAPSQDPGDRHLHLVHGETLTDAVPAARSKHNKQPQSVQCTVDTKEPQLLHTAVLC